MSQASREVLLKSVIQAIPTFTMGFFKLPLGLCNDIEALIKKKKKKKLGPLWRPGKNSLGEVRSVDKFKISGGNGV